MAYFYSALAGAYVGLTLIFATGVGSNAIRPERRLHAYLFTLFVAAMAGLHICAAVS